MLDDFVVPVTGEQRIILQTVGQVWGMSAEDTAAYFVTRGLDDLFRSGAVSLSNEETDA